MANKRVDLTDNRMKMGRMIAHLMKQIYGADWFNTEVFMPKGVVDDEVGVCIVLEEAKGGYILKFEDV